jgi:hypothetical protein
VYGTVTEHVLTSRLNIGAGTAIGSVTAGGFAFRRPPCAPYETHSP